jgi:hypothetical protein
MDAVLARFARAGDAIAAIAPSPALAARRTEAEAALRHHHLLARGMPGWAHPLLRLWRSLPLPAALRRGARNLFAR